MMDPLDGDRVIDHVGGQSDLKQGIIRTIGDPERRFGEDKLRMLRAVRFSARFGYPIEEKTFEAIKRLAVDIQQVSNERVRDELTKMLTEGRAKHAFELLDESGLLKEVMPEAVKMKGVEQFGDFGMELSFAFTTKPGEQFIVRRRAYTMILDAFSENGIEFAHPTVHVGGDEKAAAASAATTTAYARQKAEQSVAGQA